MDSEGGSSVQFSGTAVKSWETILGASLIHKPRVSCLGGVTHASQFRWSHYSGVRQQVNCFWLRIGVNIHREDRGWQAFTLKPPTEHTHSGSYIRQDVSCCRSSFIMVHFHSSPVLLLLCTIVSAESLVSLEKLMQGVAIHFIRCIFAHCWSKVIDPMTWTLTHENLCYSKSVSLWEMPQDLCYSFQQ